MALWSYFQTTQTLIPLVTIDPKINMFFIEMGPDLTQTYFWPAVYKRPTHPWPSIFWPNTRPYEIFWSEWKKLKKLWFLGEIFEIQPNPDQKNFEPDQTLAWSKSLLHKAAFLSINRSLFIHFFIGMVIIEFPRILLSLHTCSLQTTLIVSDF